MDLVVSAPFGCPNKNIRHETDDLKDLHGSLDKPIPVPEMREDKYVAWEYEEIGRQVVPFNKCFQQLFEDKNVSPRKAVDRVVVRDIGGRHHVFYFDISIQSNAARVQFAQAVKDYEAGKPIDPQRKVYIEKAIAAQKKNSRIVKL
jgi:hypothetical protein